MESGWKRDAKVHKGWDLCLCGGGCSRCGGVVVVGGVGCSDGGDGSGGVHGSGGNNDKSGMCRSGEDSGNIVHRSVGGGLCGSVEILVLGAVFVVQVVEGVELEVGCVVGRVVMLVLWCVNERRFFFALF